MVEKVMDKDNIEITNQEQKAAPAKKRNFIVRAIDGTRRVILRARATKSGRVIIRVTKTAVAGLSLYGAYKAGQRSTKPVTVVVDTGVATEPMEEETPAEEESAEQTEEVVDNEIENQEE